MISFFLVFETSWSFCHFCLFQYWCLFCLCQFRSLSQTIGFSHYVWENYKCKEATLSLPLLFGLRDTQRLGFRLLSKLETKVAVFSFLSSPFNYSKSQGTLTSLQDNSLYLLVRSFVTVVAVHFFPNSGISINKVTGFLIGLKISVIYVKRSGFSHMKLSDRLPIWTFSRVQFYWSTFGSSLKPWFLIRPSREFVFFRLMFSRPCILIWLFR